MTYRALDSHAHYRTGERKAGTPKLADADKLFKSDLRSVDPVAYYAERDLMGVIFDVDAETASGERMSNDEVAELAARSEGRLIGFASVDPWKGKAAIRELERCRELGMRGLKLQPISQAFALNDRRFYPLWDAVRALGMPMVVHTGTTGIGAGAPGGRGLHLGYGRPVPALDDVAADFPDLTIIAAHFAWPWHLELMAVARHKGNVYVDLSGWAPRYIPAEVLTYANSVIPDKFLFGSDFPLLSPDRWLEEFAALPLKDTVRPKILYENACRVLDLDPALFAEGQG
ncbi:MAG TPA: amidohydrolase family protein [Candidatus Limnocylindrales bacterium]|nr:amidohydrolase family protein [Candidatus Limnocylindrales bacterium]